MANEKLEQQHIENIRSAMNEVQDLLTKSGYGQMAKQDDEYESPAQADEQMGGESGMPEGEMDPPAEEAAPEGEMPEDEPEMGDDDYMGEMAEHATSLSDEELDQMIAILMQEKDSRGAAEGGEDEVQQSMDMEKAYKEDYLKLNKSMQSMSKVVQSLQKSNQDLVKEIKTLKASKKKVTQKAAASNSVDVLEKSSINKTPSQKNRLSKSDTLDFAIQRQREGDKLINPGIIQELSTANTDERLHEIQDSLAKQGLKFPEL